jgi:hypothetical protein
MKDKIESYKDFNKKKLNIKNRRTKLKKLYLLIIIVELN